jgi:hypothetical protein
MHVLLWEDGKDLTARIVTSRGTSPAACHDTNGVNPKDIPHKSRRQGGGEQPPRRRRFGGPAWK